MGITAVESGTSCRRNRCLQGARCRPSTPRYSLLAPIQRRGQDSTAWAWSRPSAVRAFSSRMAHVLLRFHVCLLASTPRWPTQSARSKLTSPLVKVFRLSESLDQQHLKLTSTFGPIAPRRDLLHRQCSITPITILQPPLQLNCFVREGRN